MFVFESGIWYNVGLPLISFVYVLVRSLSLVDLKRMKKAWANPNTINHKTTKNGKTSFATPVIMIKYFPNDGNTRKNNKNLKFSKKLVNDIIQRDGSFPVLSQRMDVTMGKEYAPMSIKDEFWVKKINWLYIRFILTTYQIGSKHLLYKFLFSIKVVEIQKINV